MGLFFNDSIAFTLSITASILTIVSYVSCDYVRLHFADENGFQFEQDSWVNLGLTRHQDYGLDTTKTPFEWEFDSKCLTYDQTAKDLFKYGSLKDATGWTIGALVCALAVTFATFFFILARKGTVPILARVVVMIASLISAFLQIGANEMVFSPTNGGVCDPRTYEESALDTRFPSWNDGVHKVGEYITFFDKCTRGSDAIVAIVAYSFQFATCFWIIVVLVEAISKRSKDEKAKVKAAKVVKAAAASYSDVEAQAPVPPPATAEDTKEEEAEEETKEAEAKEEEEEEAQVEDDISYEEDVKNKSGIEEEIAADDDLEIETQDENSVADPAPKVPSVLSATSMKSGGF